TPPPQGSSLGSGLWCPGPSSLNRPHPSHSWAHRDFTAWRLIRDAFAVRERLGDPRVVPGFRCSFRPDMPDGKGAWRDNVFVERLWRSVKSEEVYLHAYDTVSEARASIGRYFEFYNQRRPHASLDGSTPDQAYFTPLPLRMAA